LLALPPEDALGAIGLVTTALYPHRILNHTRTNGACQIIFLGIHKKPIVPHNRRGHPEKGEKKKRVEEIFPEQPNSGLTTKKKREREPITKKSLGAIKRQKKKAIVVLLSKTSERQRG